MYPEPMRRQLPAYFKSLASPTRLRILERLSEAGEQSVSDLTAHLRMSQPRVSWHLAMLRRGGAVRSRRVGRQVRLTLDMGEIRRMQLGFWELLAEKKRMGVSV